LDFTLAEVFAKSLEGYRPLDIPTSIKAMDFRGLEQFSTAFGALALNRQIKVADIFKLALPDLTQQLRAIPTWSAALAAQLSVATVIAPPPYQRLVQGPLLTGLRDLGKIELAGSDLGPASFSVVGASGAVGATTAGPPKDPEADVAVAPAADTTIALVRGFDVKLAVRVEGAFFALRSGSPDGVSQAAHSLQEAMDRTLRVAAPSEVAAAWCQSNHPKSLTADGRATRAGKVRYLAYAAGVTPEAAEPIIQLLDACTRICQKAKHDEVDALVVRHYATLVQGVVGAFVSMALAAAERIGESN